MSSQFYIIVTVMAAAIGVVFLLKYLAYREALQQAHHERPSAEQPAPSRVRGAPHGVPLLAFGLEDY